MKRNLLKTISILSIIAIGVLAAFAIVSTYWSVGALTEETKERAYYQTMRSADAISTVFENAEGTVDTLEVVVRHGFDADRYQNDPSYIDEYVEELAPIIESSLLNVNDAAGLYCTFDPDYFGRDQSYEIWYSLDENGTPIHTDANVNGVYFEAFDDANAPHMQYFFQAKQHPGETVWIDPAYDPDIEQDVITCSKGVFIDGKMIGVIGIDIYTQHTTDLISALDIEDGGAAFLLNADDKQIVASKQEKGLNTQSIWQACMKQMANKPSDILTVSANQTAYVVTYGSLTNGWKLAVVNTEAQLYEHINHIQNLILVVAAFLAALLLLLMFLIFRRFTDPMQKAEDLLRNIDPDNPSNEQEEDLLQLVQRQVDRQREKDLLIAHQSRLTKAGEMLSAILHQWKQPLNKLNILYGNLEDAVEYGDLTEEDLKHTASRSREIVQSMTETINDFRGYLEPESEPSAFSLQRTILSVLELLEDRLTKNNIRIIEDYQFNEMLVGYRNALYHVLLNIIANAIDAIESTGQSDGYIAISTDRQVDETAGPTDETNQQAGDMVSIKIHNNGGPLSNEIQQTLFTPYNTTKSAADGSGLGLAISKNLIEKNMDGTLQLYNETDGVTCLILLHKKGSDSDDK
ncbi:MAG: sensor histidine kinase [Firmicutes bacterium]|nr:sensor histidine kinase [Bacillota bacterium]